MLDTYLTIVDVAKKVISLTQTTFKPGRDVIEAAVILHKMIHEMHRKKQDRVTF